MEANKKRETLVAILVHFVVSHKFLVLCEVVIKSFPTVFSQRY